MRFNITTWTALLFRLLHCSLPVLGWPFLASLEESRASPFVLLVVTIQQELLQLPPQLSDQLLGPAGTDFKPPDAMHQGRITLQYASHACMY